MNGDRWDVNKTRSDSVVCLISDVSDVGEAWNQIRVVVQPMVGGTVWGAGPSDDIQMITNIMN